MQVPRKEVIVTWGMWTVEHSNVKCTVRMWSVLGSQYSPLNRSDRGSGWVEGTGVAFPYRPVTSPPPARQQGCSVRCVAGIPIS